MNQSKTNKANLWKSKKKQFFNFQFPYSALKTSTLFCFCSLSRGILLIKNETLQPGEINHSICKS